MLEAILILIFVVAFALVWFSILYLIKHPNINFDLEAKALAHEPTLQEHIQKIKLYLHEEEMATIDELEALLNISYEEIVEILVLLESRNQISFKFEDETITLI